MDASISCGIKAVQAQGRMRNYLMHRKINKPVNFPSFACLTNM